MCHVLSEIQRKMSIIIKSLFSTTKYGFQKIEYCGNEHNKIHRHLTRQQSMPFVILWHV
jgi:hypothetical protein